MTVDVRQGTFVPGRGARPVLAAPLFEGAHNFTPQASVQTHPEFPLERTCVHTYEPFQLKFARHAQHLLSVASCELEVDAGHHGLTLRAETEGELVLAASILRSFYGNHVQIGPVTVRNHQGTTLEHPIMGLRVKCTTPQVAAIKADLWQRAATIASVEMTSQNAVVCAVAPMRYLLGYARVLRRLTGGNGSHTMWLSHYQPAGEVSHPAAQLRSGR